MEEVIGLAPADGNDYTYLTLPPNEELRSCIGLVLAGLAARAKIGAAGLEEAVKLLEDQHAVDGPTRYRFSLKEDGLVAQIEEEKAAARGDGETFSGWRTVVEMVS